MSHGIANLGLLLVLEYWYHTVNQVFLLCRWLWY